VKRTFINCGIMEEDNDFVFFVMAIALVQMTAPYLLLKEYKNR